MKSDRLIDDSLTDLIGRMIGNLGADRTGNQRRGFELLGRLREFYQIPDPPTEDDSAAFDALSTLSKRYLTENLAAPESTVAVLTFGTPVPI